MRSRQVASRDAHAAYLNAIRWYISGDTRYADSAINICNAWSNTVNQVASGGDTPGLSGIPIAEFALAAEVLRVCPFPAIADQQVGTATLKLGATSDAGLLVSYYVVSGPAEIDGDILRFTPIPLRAKLPLKVTVVAWQWGCGTEPRVKTAAPVTQEFSLVGTP